ncbi:hypothetical protein LTR78_002872 [Recurvomyces mirabilis]|uniref:DUF1275 domain protein n=1 Tax=Recurvomyces mirabilis TaxID=574656 RepID=A0AAE1C402_9PEZI|nr:hypothetical protein LTR78_002872 [Recurvomyces mirabilis]KAK5159395.1 hypothetical protein LTS14_002537 [Recurvomyces mirabilis]
MGHHRHLSQALLLAAIGDLVMRPQQREIGSILSPCYNRLTIIIQSASEDLENLITPDLSSMTDLDHPIAVTNHGAQRLPTYTSRGSTGPVTTAHQDITRSGRLLTVQRYWASPIRADSLIEAQLLILTFATGIQDSISYPDFRCFASNQTGNTVVLAVALAGGVGELFDPANVGASLGAFLLGALATGHLGLVFGRRRRVWQFTVGLAQTMMVLGAAWIQFGHGANESGVWPRAALALIATASGSQVAAARAFQIPEITTAMATAAWVDFIIDENLLLWRNRSRNRRALFLFVLVAGSFAGAYARAGIGSPKAIIISGVLKGLATLLILFATAVKTKPPAQNSTPLDCTSAAH